MAHKFSSIYAIREDRGGGEFALVVIGPLIYYWYVHGWEIITPALIEQHSVQFDSLLFP